MDLSKEELTTILAALTTTGGLISLSSRNPNAEEDLLKIESVKKRLIKHFLEIENV